MTPDRADAGLLSELADTGPFSNHRMLKYFPHTCSSSTGIIGAIEVEQLGDVRDVIACAVQYWYSSTLLQTLPAEQADSSYRSDHETRSEQQHRPDTSIHHLPHCCSLRRGRIGRPIITSS